MRKRSTPDVARDGLPARIARRYEVVEELARGGMGVVYRVADVISGDERALKRIRMRDPRHRHVYRAAFEREYQVLSTLDHPRIIRVYEYGIDDDGPYYVMELVRGEDLRPGMPRPWKTVCCVSTRGSRPCRSTSRARTSASKIPSPRSRCWRSAPRAASSAGASSRPASRACATVRAASSRRGRSVIGRWCTCRRRTATTWACSSWWTSRPRTPTQGWGGWRPRSSASTGCSAVIATADTGWRRALGERAPDND